MPRMRRNTNRREVLQMWELPVILPLQSMFQQRHSQTAQVLATVWLRIRTHQRELWFKPQNLLQYYYYYTDFHGVRRRTKSGIRQSGHQGLRCQRRSWGPWWIGIVINRASGWDGFIETSALIYPIEPRSPHRTLNSADYELLHQLDSVVHNQSHSPINSDPTCPDYIVASIPTEVVAESKWPVVSTDSLLWLTLALAFITNILAPDSSLLDPSNQCMVCQFSYRRYDRVKILPGCKHKFHVECIDRWASGT